MFLSNRNDITEFPITPKQFIEKKIEGDNFILVTSTEKISRKWNLELMRYTNRAFHKTDIYSFKNFVNEFSKQILHKNLIDEILENEIIINAIEESKSKNKLLNDYNYTKQISSIIRGMREDGIRAKKLQEDLLDIIERDEYDYQKLRYLVMIMSSYENQLYQLNYLDYPLAMENLTTILSEEKSITDKTFLFQDFTNFRKPDIDLIEMLSEAGNNIIITTHINQNSGPFLGDENFFLNDLKEIGFSLFDNNSELVESDVIYSNLGIEKSTEALSNRFNSKLNIHSLINIREETYAITKLVKYLIHKKKYKPSDICVASRDVGAYSVLIREFFADNKIPTNITDRYKMSQSPIAIAIIDILETALNNFALENLTKVLDSAYIETGINNPKHLIYLSNKYRLIGGTPNKGITLFITQLSSRLEALNRQKKNNSIGREIVSLNDAIQNFKDLEILFQNIDINKLYTIDEFVELINHIVNVFEIEKRILDLDTILQDENIDFNETVYLSERIEKDGRALFKILEVLNKLKVFLNDLDENKKYSLLDLVLKFKGILSITRYQIREKKNYGVDVTSIEQTRGLDYKVKIMAGAVEGMMPLGFKTDRLVGKILQDSERRHYFNEYIQFHQFMSDENIDEYFIFTHREENSALKIESHFIEPLINSLSSVVNTDYTDLNWQNTIINRRELLLSQNSESKILFDDNFNVILDNYKKNNDLKVNINIDDDELYQILKTQTFSISKINSFSNYPYSYFYSNLLNLEEYENAEIFLTNIELGLLLHSSIELTFNLYKSKHTEIIKKIIDSREIANLELIKLSDNDRFEIVSLFKNIVLEKLETFGINRQFFNLDKLYLVGTDEADGIMIKWFDRVIERHIESNYFIAAHEYFFSSVNSENFNLQLSYTGKIDRVDISEDLKTFRIIDYKLNASDRESLQLSVYSSVMSNLFKNKYGLNLDLDDLVFDSFKYGNEDKKKMEYKSFKENKRIEIRDIVIKDMDKATEITRNMIKMDFEKSLKNYNKAFDSFEIALLQKN